MGTEFRLLLDGPAAAWAKSGLRLGLSRSSPEGLGEHGRHHESHSHADARPCFSLILGGGFQGHGGLHFQELVQIVEDAQPALVVDRLLHLRRRGDRVDVKVGQTQAELGEIGLDERLELLGELVVSRGRLKIVSMFSPMKSLKRETMTRFRYSEIASVV